MSVSCVEVIQPSRRFLELEYRPGLVDVKAVVCSTVKSDSELVLDPTKRQDVGNPVWEIPDPSISR
jgi:hypothetical protein